MQAISLLITNKTSSAALPSRQRRASALSSLRRIAPYASILAPRRLASDALLVNQECRALQVSDSKVF